MELKDTKIVFHELCIKMMICYSLKFSVSLFNIHTRVLKTQFHAQEKCRNREHCQAILIFASRFDISRSNIWSFHACSSSNPKILARNLFTLSSNMLFNSILEDILPCSWTLFLVMCCSTNKIERKQHDY